MIGPGGIVFLPGGYFVPTGVPAFVLSLLLWTIVLADALHRARLSRAARRRQRAARQAAEVPAA